MSDEAPLPTAEFIKRLQELEAREKSRAAERHKFNQYLQVALTSLGSGQEETTKTIGDVSGLLIQSGREIARLKATVFGPNEDNGLRGSVKDMSKALRDMKDTFERRMDDLETSFKAQIGEQQKQLNSLYVKVLGIVVAISGAGIGVNKIFFQ